jgi:hypothetical protein
MRIRFVLAFVVAMMIGIGVHRAEAAGFSQTLCDMSDGKTCSLSYELWSMATCYGNGFLCWRAW